MEDLSQALRDFYSDELLNFLSEPLENPTNWLTKLAYVSEPTGRWTSTRMWLILRYFDLSFEELSLIKLPST